MNIHKKQVVFFLVCLICLLAISVPIAGAEGKYSKLSDFSGKQFAMVQGTVYDKLVPRNPAFTDHEAISYYNNDIDALEALRSGKVDAVLQDRHNAEILLTQFDDIMIFPEDISPDSYGFGFKKGSELLSPFNEAMRKLKSEGLDDILKEKWTGTDESQKVLIKQDWDVSGGTLRYWVNTGTPPMSYIGPEGTPIGLAVDYVLHVAREMGYGVEITECAFDGLIPALQSGRADLAGRSMSITEERKKNIDFSDPFYEGTAVIVVRISDVDPSLISEDRSISSTTSSDKSFWESIADEFESTFISEERWKMVLSGLWATLRVTFASIILGTLLGFCIYLLTWRFGKGITSVIDVVAGLIVGIPAVVFLMIFYYIIFKSSSLSGVTISIFAFSIIFAISVYRMIQTGASAIDRGQLEGAYALGYSKTQTFFEILLPQAILYIFPIYKGELSNLLRATAIVGYIAVQDLTRIGDLIRSRTFKAFFPLLSIALVYYILGKLITLLANIVQKKLDPMKRNNERILKGVKKDV